ncbi:MAG: hypothetical protein IKC31_05305 [Clostridia bacterium]|nr:hypothetical protein [Clostridia bacterium]
MIDFIPTIWSETLLTELERRYVGIANCSHIYSDELKNKGSQIKLCGLYSVGVGDYDPVMGLEAPSTLSNYTKTLTADQVKCFNFMLDDMEKTQASEGLMKLALKSATDSLAEQAEEYLYGMFNDTPNVITMDQITAENVVDALLAARTALFKKNVCNAEDVVFEVSPEVAELIYKAKLTLTGDGETFENGCVGRFMGSKIYVSNHVRNSASPNDGNYYHCIVRTKRAVAFAERLSEIIAYRPDNFFSDAIKGLHIYGASIIYPDELLRLDIEIRNAE